MFWRVIWIIDINIGWFGWIPKDAKLFVRDDVATSFGLQPMCATKMVGMAMRHNDRVNPL